MEKYYRYKGTLLECEMCGVVTFLVLSGFNNRAFVKIDENEGEKCILIEICSKQEHKCMPVHQ